ncbi:MAG TPA: hypothetical protein VKV38_05030 [Trebonia sp.]|nr:hypothetical protein [Trebonia sp.]
MGSLERRERPGGIVLAGGWAAVAGGVAVAGVAVGDPVAGVAPGDPVTGVAEGDPVTDAEAAGVTVLPDPP